MSGIRRYSRYLVIIALLAVMVGIKYIAGDNTVSQDGKSISDLSPDKYILHADDAVRTSAVRDIFDTGHKQTVQQYPQNNVRFRNPVTSAVKTTPEIKETEQKPEEHDGEIERIKLLGIVFHDNKKKAYMALDKQRVIADIGDLVYGRYLLKDIAVNSAELVDTRENQQKTIMVSGK